ncbi:MAG: GxxExxY protein [Usitatibacter sp.]
METQMNADAAQMNADVEERARLNRLSRMVIGAAQRVSSRLGYGFLEKVYENALVLELGKEEVLVEQQHPVHVLYEGRIVGDYVPDLLVGESLIVEIKAIQGLDLVHRQQCLNYLRATDLRLGLLLNFGRAHLEVARVVHNF